MREWGEIQEGRCAMLRQILLGGLFVVVGVMAVATAQAQREPASTDDLLTEVRGLRSEINEAAGASIRAQLLVARLQLQEHRITTLAGQLEEIRRMLSTFGPGQV